MAIKEESPPESNARNALPADANDREAESKEIAELFGANAIGSSNAAFKQSTGDDLYRRSLYTYWKRQIPAANMRILGADGRTTCRTRRERTNTPLQALVLLNGPQFVEAARALAERAMREGGDTPPERLGFAFRLATSRHVRPEDWSFFSRSTMIA